MVSISLLPQNSSEVAAPATLENVAKLLASEKILGPLADRQSGETSLAICFGEMATGNSLSKSSGLLSQEFIATDAEALEASLKRFPEKTVRPLF
jgi:hypothetical protein